MATQERRRSRLLEVFGGSFSRLSGESQDQDQDQDDTEGCEIPRCEVISSCKYVAAFWCTDCQASLCETCNDKVHKNSVFSNTLDHDVLPIDLKPLECPEHKKRMEFFCPVENEVVCLFCTAIGTHRGHTVEPLKALAEERRKAHKPELDKLLGFQTTLQEKYTEIRNLDKLLVDHKHREMDLINTKIKSRLGQLEEITNKEVDELYQREKENLLKTLDEQFTLARAQKLKELRKTVSSKKHQCLQDLENLTVQKDQKINVDRTDLDNVLLQIRTHASKAKIYIKQGDAQIMSNPVIVEELQDQCKSISRAIDRGFKSLVYSSPGGLPSEVDCFKICEFNPIDSESEGKRDERFKSTLMVLTESVELSQFSSDQPKCNGIFDAIGIVNGRPLFGSRNNVDRYLWYRPTSSRWLVSSKEHIGTSWCVAYTSSLAEHPILIDKDCIWNEFSDKSGWFNNTNVSVATAQPKCGSLGFVTVLKQKVKTV